MRYSRQLDTKRLTVEIRTVPSLAYDVVIGAGVMQALGSSLVDLLNARRATVVTNDQVWSAVGATVTDSLENTGIMFDLISVPDGEAFKTFETASGICEALADCGASRADPVIAVGGGVVGDLTGFAASVYMRGVPFINLPTTLLAMADSSVGGKTAVDLPAGKNLAGTFYQPRLVLEDVDVLKTLPDVEMAAGRTEMFKAACLLGGEFLEAWQNGVNRLLNRDLEALVDLLSRAIRYKADVVGADERDISGQRAVLNFGHTLGHALETAEGYESLGHGAAVALGMSFAAHLGELIGASRAGLATETERLLEAAGLTTKRPVINPAKLIAIMGLDKKTAGGNLNFVLLEDFGRPIVRPVPTAAVEAALEEFLNA
jgi:3-dehydroquinate synthase